MNKRRGGALWRIPIGDIELDENLQNTRAIQGSAKGFAFCGRVFESLNTYRDMQSAELQRAVTI